MIKNFTEHRKKLKRYLTIHGNTKFNEEEKQLAYELRKFAEERFSSLKTKVSD